MLPQGSLTAGKERVDPPGDPGHACDGVEAGRQVHQRQPDLGACGADGRGGLGLQVGHLGPHRVGRLVEPVR
jgi:hypothetical protein